MNHLRKTFSVVFRSHQAFWSSFIFVVSASQVCNAAETLLICKPGVNGAPLYKVDYIKEESGVYRSLVTTEEEIEFTESSSALEWHMKDLTLPNVENKAYRLRLSADESLWTLIEYTIDNLEYYYEMVCESPQ